MKALIHNSIVVQVSQDEFPVHSSMQWVDIPAELEVKAYKFKYENEEFSEIQEDEEE